MIRRAALSAVCLLSSLASSAQGGFNLEPFRETYLTTGIPLRGPVGWDTADVKFQLSFMLPVCRSLGGVDGLDLSVGYSQRSVWMLYRESSPFKDNMYIPGIYLSVPLGPMPGSLLAGIEHRSNGVDGERSRSINYVFAEYSRDFGQGLSLLAGARCGYGYYQSDIVPEIFTSFAGVVSLGAAYTAPDGRWSALLSCSPVFGPFGVNVTAELSHRIGGALSPYHVFVQCHHGYDECFADCVYGSAAPSSLRFGILFLPKGVRRLSM